MRPSCRRVCSGGRQGHDCSSQGRLISFRRLCRRIGDPVWSITRWRVCPCPRRDQPIPGLQKSPANGWSKIFNRRNPSEEDDRRPNRSDPYLLFQAPGACFSNPAAKRNQARNLRKFVGRRFAHTGAAAARSRQACRNFEIETASFFRHHARNMLWARKFFLSREACCGGGWMKLPGPDIGNSAQDRRAPKPRHRAELDFEIGVSP